MILNENCLPAVDSHEICLTMYLLFLKKQQNLKLSSAANYWWRFMGYYMYNLPNSVLKERLTLLFMNIGTIQKTLTHAAKYFVSDCNDINGVLFIHFIFFSFPTYFPLLLFYDCF